MAERAAFPHYMGRAHIHGGWQPWEIIAAGEEQLTSVFVPALPSIETGNLYALESGRVFPLDVPLDEFRADLKTRGRGTKRWAAALDAAGLAKPEG